MTTQSLELILQMAHKGFAYEILSFQIEIQEDSPSKRTHKIQSISKLIQLYMLGVQALEGKSDRRYKYFNNKIQNLMKKKYIIQQLHLASTGKLASKKDLRQVTKAQIYQFDAAKIRQLMNTTEKKLKKFESNIINDLKKQEDKIQQRRKIRRMKSETGSISKFDKDNNFFQCPKQIKTEKEIDDYFKIEDNLIKNKEQKIRKRSGSIQKQKQKNTNVKLRQLLL